VLLHLVNTNNSLGGCWDQYQRHQNLCHVLSIWSSLSATRCCVALQWFLFMLCVLCRAVLRQKGPGPQQSHHPKTPSRPLDPQITPLNLKVQKQSGFVSFTASTALPAARGLFLHHTATAVTSRCTARHMWLHVHTHHRCLVSLLTCLQTGTGQWSGGGATPRDPQQEASLFLMRSGSSTNIQSGVQFFLTAVYTGSTSVSKAGATITGNYWHLVGPLIAEAVMYWQVQIYQVTPCYQRYGLEYLLLDKSSSLVPHVFLPCA